MKWILQGLWIVFLAGCNQPVAEKEPEEMPHGAAAVQVAFPDTIPVESLKAALPDYDTTQWTELIALAPDIMLDLKYATEDNFVQSKMYDCGRCFLRPKVAEALVRVQQTLRKQDLGLKMFDCYRPRPIQWKLWEKVPDPRYVTDPRKGSMHNRGAAVDLGLVDLAGNELDMGAPFDFFGQRAYQTYIDLPDSILQRRRLLRSTMEAQGFHAIRTEWWHYSFNGGFELSDMVWKCETAR